MGNRVWGQAEGGVTVMLVLVLAVSYLAITVSSPVSRAVGVLVADVKTLVEQDEDGDGPALQNVCPSDADIDFNLPEALASNIPKIAASDTYPTFLRVAHSNYNGQTFAINHMQCNIPRRCWLSPENKKANAVND